MKKILCVAMTVMMIALVFVGCSRPVDKDIAGRWELLAERGWDFNDKLYLEFLGDGTVEIYTGYQAFEKERSITYEFDDDIIEIFFHNDDIHDLKLRVDGDLLYGTEDGNNGPIYIREEDKALSEEEQNQMKQKLAGMWEKVEQEQKKTLGVMSVIKDEESARKIKEYWKFNEDGTLETYLDDVHLADDGKVYYNDVFQEPVSEMFYTLSREGVTIYYDHERLHTDLHPRKANGPVPFNALGTYKLEGNQLLQKGSVYYEKVE